MNRPPVANILASSELLYNNRQIASAIRSTAEELSARLLGEDAIALTIMNGGMMFAAKLLRYIAVPIQCEYIHLKRYGDELQGQGKPEWEVNPPEIRNRTVLLLDDIFDEGHTLAEAIRGCKQMGAKEVITAVMCFKNGKLRPEGFKLPDYMSLTVPNRFVFGYGMDYKGYMRNLNGIFALPENWK